MDNLQARIVSDCLTQNRLTISSYIHHLVDGATADPMTRELHKEAISICANLYCHVPAVLAWSICVAKEAICAEVHEPSKVGHGLHFNAKKAMSEYLEGSFMREATDKMRSGAPRLWHFVQSLLDARVDQRRAVPNEDIEM